MRIQTMRLGQLEALEVPDEAVIRFPAGVPGFEEYTEYALIEDPEYHPFCWLQALHEPVVRFLLIDPWLAKPDYEIELNDQDLAQLGLGADDRPLVLCILSVRDDDVATATANLRAPVVINQRGGLGAQVILADERYPLRQPVFQGDSALTGTSGNAERQEGAPC
jgi:flagellar assembly factor FliW